MRLDAPLRAVGHLYPSFEQVLDRDCRFGTLFEGCRPQPGSAVEVASHRSPEFLVLVVVLAGPTAQVGGDDDAVGSLAVEIGDKLRVGAALRPQNSEGVFGNRPAQFSAGAAQQEKDRSAITSRCWLTSAKTRAKLGGVSAGSTARSRPMAWRRKVWRCR